MKKETAASEKSKILMRTYITSLLSLMLCVTMLLGTTYAWFTSEVTTAGNEIYVGMLQVAMTDEGGDSLAGAKALFGNTTERAFRWEPGATQVETVKIVNTGDLAFHYSLYLSTIDANVGYLAEVGQYIYVYTIAGTDYTKDKFVASEWQLKGTLKDIVADGAVLAGGSYTAVAQTNDKATDTTKQDVATVTIALHMMEDTTDSTIMGKSIENLGIKLVATQINAEKDSFSSDYDKDAALPVSTPAALKSALESGASVKLLNDIELDERLVITGDQAINLNGKTLAVSDSFALRVEDEGELSIKAGTVSAPNGYAIGLFGDASINAEDVVFNGADGLAMNANLTSEKSSATFTGCEFHITSGFSSAYISAKGTYTFKDCVLDSGCGILIRSGNVTLDGCTIIANGEKGKGKVQPAFYYNAVVENESDTIKNGVAYWTEKNQDITTGDCVAIVDRSGDGYELKSVTITNCTFKFADTVVGKSYAIRYFDKAEGTAVAITPVVENNFVEDANGVKNLATSEDPTVAGTYSIYKK